MNQKRIHLIEIASQSNLFDIDNFIINSNSAKNINLETEKLNSVPIIIPKFKQLAMRFFTLNKRKRSLHLLKKLLMNIMKNFIQYWNSKKMR